MYEMPFDIDQSFEDEKYSELWNEMCYLKNIMKMKTELEVVKEISIPKFISRVNELRMNRNCIKTTFSTSNEDGKTVHIAYLEFECGYNDPVGLLKRRIFSIIDSWSSANDPISIHNLIKLTKKYNISDSEFQTGLNRLIDLGIVEETDDEKFMIADIRKESNNYDKNNSEDRNDMHKL